MLDPARLAESNSDELLEEIRRKEQMSGLAPVVLAISVVGFVLFLLTLGAQASHWVIWAFFAIGLLGLLSLPWAMWSDRRARLVRLHYVFDPLGDKVQEGLARFLAAFERCMQSGRCTASTSTAIGNETPGLERRSADGALMSDGGPRRSLRRNARVGFLNVDGIRLFFFPDRLLIFGAGGASAVGYADLKLETGTVQFREEGGVPRDAKVTGTTWRYVNKNGSPDRRFNNNYQIPIVLYGTVDVSAPSGMRLSLQTSADGLCALRWSFCASFRRPFAISNHGGPASSAGILAQIRRRTTTLVLAGDKGLPGIGQLRFVSLARPATRVGNSGYVGHTIRSSAGIRHCLVRERWLGGERIPVFLVHPGCAGIGILLYRHLRRSDQHKAAAKAATKSRFSAPFLPTN